MLLGIAFLLVANGGRAAAQETRSEHYMRHAHLVATFPLTFPGPDGGYTMAHVPVQEITHYGDTIVVTRAFLVDLGTANDGNYVMPDTMRVSTGYTAWTFPLGGGHALHASLAPSGAYTEYKQLDSTYFGTLGYAFFKQFLTVFDFKRQVLSLYTLYSTVDVADRDTMAMQVPYFDDAVLTYCHCAYPTMWLDAEAPPLKAGRVSIGFNKPRSAIYQPALDPKTAKQLKKALKDSVGGKPVPVGLSLATFSLMGYNIAPRNPHRWVEPQPLVFKDLSIFVMGAIGTDLLRSYSGFIIDPARMKVVFVK